MRTTPSYRPRTVHPPRWTFCLRFDFHHHSYLISRISHTRGSCTHCLHKLQNIRDPRSLESENIEDRNKRISTCYHSPPSPNQTWTSLVADMKLRILLREILGQGNDAAEIVSPLLSCILTDTLEHPIFRNLLCQFHSPIILLDLKMFNIFLRKHCSSPCWGHWFRLCQVANVSHGEERLPTFASGDTIPKWNLKNSPGHHSNVICWFYIGDSCGERGSSCVKLSINVCTTLA